jgi:TRAP-type mannitol/chloroaromatic compound transport system permease small subunit
MNAYVRIVDTISMRVGQAVSWLILLAVIVSAGNAVARKAFSLSSNAWLELQWYLYGAAFLLGAAWTLSRNEHVRIDVLSSLFSARVRAVIDLIGHVVVLVPFCTLILWLSYPWVARSYATGEQSANAGGLILWPAKALVLAGFALLLAQTIAEIIKSIRAVAQARP